MRTTSGTRHAAWVCVVATGVLIARPAHGAALPYPEPALQYADDDAPAPSAVAEPLEACSTIGEVPNVFLEHV